MAATQPIQTLELAQTPPLIEHAFPAQKISAEAQKERKAGSGQTLTGLGSYWKGRKPLIMARAIILATLLPATEDTEADLAIFEQLMGIDDASFGRREPTLSAKTVAQMIALDAPWAYFTHAKPGADRSLPERFPLTADEAAGLNIRWRAGIRPEDKQAILAEALTTLPYEERLRHCKRPEECDPETLYGPIWANVNAHLARFGIEADSHAALIRALGERRYGRTPRVGDTFTGGGSIPFEAARLGCEAYASDLNPVACMLTWGAFNIVGASPERRAEIEAERERVVSAVDAEITALGVEHNERGDRGKAYLYCLEARCPESGWLVPLAPSWIISKPRRIVADLVPNPTERRYDIEIISGASDAQMRAADAGTVQKGIMVHTLEGTTYRTPIRTLRGDYTDANGVNRNTLRPWTLEDVRPRADDVFQERLYAIQWITAETLDVYRKETYFAAPDAADLEREREIATFVEAHLAEWQAQGFVPDMRIEAGDNTNQPMRERGWQYWHQLFNPRHLLVNATVAKHAKATPEMALMMAGLVDRNAALIRWNPSRDGAEHVFYNQALNTLMNYPVRGLTYAAGQLTPPPASTIEGNGQVTARSVREITDECDLWITDPPYADAVNYDEINEFFIAWLRTNLPAPFDQWTWDSRRAMAIKGDGDDFRAGMVEAYRAMAEHMPDNGRQCVMFTHQDAGVWGDMVSIFWAAGLQVTGAWYIATETSSSLRDGGHVQGTVTLILKKREGSASVFKPQLLPRIRREVSGQVDAMMRLNEEARSHGRTLFSDADLQMAGYAAALKALTGYTEVDGQDVTALALQPRQKKRKNVVDEIVEYAAGVANNLLTPARLTELNAKTWEIASPVERFYLRLVAIERGGVSKLDNYQNFAKAFGVEYAPLMASLQPNAARLKGAEDFAPRDLTTGVLANTPLGAVLVGVQELLEDKEAKGVVAEIRSMMGSAFFDARLHICAMAQFIGEMSADAQPVMAEKAMILANRVRNEGF